MKVAAVKVFLVDGARINWVIVKVETDAGIYGVGDGTVGRGERAVAATIEYFASYLVGQDPFRTELHADTMLRDSYWRTGVVHRAAVAALEAALLDIKGKALGVPVYELLGGRCRDRIRCYANNWARKTESLDVLQERAREAVGMGFDALKWDPFGPAYLQLAPAQKRNVLAQIEAVRRTVGDDVDLLIEGHGRFDVPTAIRVGQAIAPYDPLFFEEPTPPESIAAVANVRAHIPVRLATGERYYDKQQFQELVTQKAADWIQPDVVHVGGLSEFRRIAAIAAAAYLPVQPHNPLGPVGNAMSVQLCASVPNLALLETMMVDVPWRSEIVTEHCRLVDGHMLIPDGPGLGIEFHEEAALKYAYRHIPGGHFRKGDPYPEGSRPWFKIG
jgi:galactonate dehydratase